MIEIVKQLDEDWYLINLKGTTYYQIWNKWEFFKVILDGSILDESENKSNYTVFDIDHSIIAADLEVLLNKLKENYKKHSEQNKK